MKAREKPCARRILPLLLASAYFLSILSVGVVRAQSLRADVPLRQLVLTEGDVVSQVGGGHWNSYRQYLTPSQLAHGDSNESARLRKQGVWGTLRVAFNQPPPYKGVFQIENTVTGHNSSQGANRGCRWDYDHVESLWRGSKLAQAGRFYLQTTQLGDEYEAFYGYYTYPGQVQRADVGVVFCRGKYEALVFVAGTQRQSGGNLPNVALALSNIVDCRLAHGLGISGTVSCTCRDVVRGCAANPVVPRPTVMPVSTVSFHLARLATLDTSGNARSRFHPGEGLVVAGSFTIRHAGGTVRLTVTQSYQYCATSRLCSKGNHPLVLQENASDGTDRYVIPYTIPLQLDKRFKTIKITDTVLVKGKQYRRSVTIAVER